MSAFAKKFESKWTTIHENGLVTHGSTEPVLTALDLGGFEIKDMFLIGINPDCGAVIVPTKERADAVKTALEPAYAVTVGQQRGDWVADFTRRDPDGTAPSRFVTDIVLKDGTVAMKDGRPTRRPQGE